MLNILAKFVANFGIIIILTRYISPKEYGISNFTILIFNFIILGVLEAIGESYIKVKKNKDLPSQINLIFYLSLFPILMVYIIVGLFTYKFFSNLWFTNLHIILIAGIIIRLPSFIYEYHLLKVREFKLIAKIEVLSMFAYSTITILLAVNSYSYYSLVIGIFFYYSLKSFLIIYLTKSKLNINYKFKINNLAILTSYEFYISKITNYFFMNNDKIVLPIFTNFTNLGYYGRAFQLCSIPSITIGKNLETVFLSYFTNETFSKDTLEKYLNKCFSLNSIFIIPMSILIYFNSDKIINILLGQKWENTAEILKVMSPLITILFIIKIFLPALKTTKKINLSSLVFLVFGLLNIISVYYFSNKDLIFICKVVLMNYFFLVITYLYLSYKIFKINIIVYFKILTQNILFVFIFFIINLFIKDFNMIYIIVLNSLYYLLCIIFIDKIIFNKETVILINQIKEYIYNHVRHKWNN
jgi:PST family polysaccharide transporter